MFSKGKGAPGRKTVVFRATFSVALHQAGAQFSESHRSKWPGQTWSAGQLKKYWRPALDPDGNRMHRRVRVFS